MVKVDSFTYNVGKILYECNITTNPDSSSSSSSSSSWVPISLNRNLCWYDPFVFALNDKIYVVSGNKLITHHRFVSQEELVTKDDTNAGWIECFNFDSQKWHILPTPGIDRPLNHRTTVLDETKIVFYSVLDGNLFLYDVLKEECVLSEYHLDLQLSDMVVRQGLQGCRFLYALLRVADNTSPVVCDSTLYWLNNDLCLYGYDYGRKRWFQSNSLRGELDWPLSVDEDGIVDVPLLLYLDNTTFLAICVIGTKELAIALIRVNRDSVSLNVSLIMSRKFPVDTSDPSIFLFNGMAIRKDRSMLGKRKSASED